MLLLLLLSSSLDSLLFPLCSGLKIFEGKGLSPKQAQGYTNIADYASVKLAKD